MTPIAAALSLFFLLAPVASSPDPRIGVCVPTGCGNVDITYPFWVSGQQPDYCGPPEFKLNCGDVDPPSLQTPNGTYHVRSISYASQSILVVPNLTVIDVESPKADCPIYHNLTFTSTPFNVSLTNLQLLLIYNCIKQPPLLPDYHPITCGGYKSFLFLGDNYSYPEYSALPASCEVAVLPVLGFPGANSSDYPTLINDGFLLDWRADNCIDCKLSGGNCGFNTSTKAFMCICEDGVHSTSCDGKKKKIIVKIAIGVGVGGGLLAVFFVCYIWYNRGKITRQSSSFSKFLIGTRSSSIKVDQEMGSHSYRTHVFSYVELHEATNGFDESRELGDGGFGTVYKGYLRDGRVVAVKRLYENNLKRVEQFLNEVDILSRLRHPNLVTLYGCTSRHSRELLLVYEFVPNGTVADHLHGPRVPDNGLTWPIRLSIAIETAEALAYLHAAETQIIHRDVKTTNILLDNNFHVKVADFGLSRLFPLDATHVSTLPQGTPGYVDPEYHQCYQLTDKSDVYSFGVVLVELISSMPAVDICRHRHEINLANLAINKIQNREVDQLVDPRLTHGDWEIQRMTNMVAELAFRCLQADREMRPCIKEVLEELRRVEGKGEKGVEPAEIGDDARLLKNEVPFSPDTVTERWDSKNTTPNTSA